MGAENSKTNQRVSRQKVSKTKQKQSSDNGAFIFILADWCGHCQSLKTSGEIEKIEQVMEVHRMSDKSDGYKDFMQEVGSRGFPTIIMVKGDKMKQYSGDRTANDMLQKFQQFS